MFMTSTPESKLFILHSIERRTRVKRSSFKREFLGVWPTVRSGQVMTSFFIPLLL
jgi:hypothetical protein